MVTLQNIVTKGTDRITGFRLKMYKNNDLFINFLNDIKNCQ